MPKAAEDLTGRKFGAWTVICRDINRRRRPYWICECRCGKRSSKNGNLLTCRMRRPKCCLSCINSSKIKLIPVNTVIGKWTVLGMDVRSHQGTNWVCRCECGNIESINGTRLRKRKACVKCKRREKFEHLKSRKFGLLSVIGPPHVRKGKYVVLCKCDCGNETIQQVATLTRGTGKWNSCGCQRRATGKSNRNYRGGDIIGGTQWCQIYRGRARPGRTLKFNISLPYVEEIVRNQKHKSAFGGEHLTFGRKGNASLDRIDSSKGYVIGNVQWITKEEQKMKMDLSVVTVLRNVKRIYENLSLNLMGMPEHQVEIKCAA